MTDILDTEQIKIRVSEWIKFKKQQGLTQEKIADEFKVTKGYISGLANKRDSVGLNVVQYILNYDKHLNARWLILGEGEMYHERGKSENNLDSYVNKNNCKQTVEVLEKLIEAQKEQINTLNENIKLLKELNKK